MPANCLNGCGCHWQAVAERIGQDLGDVVQLNCIVDRICWDGETVRIGCRDGRVLEADAVVITVSLGVLKASAQSADHSYPAGLEVMSGHLRSRVLRRLPGFTWTAAKDRGIVNQLFHA